MIGIILLLCVPVAIAIYALIVRPFIVPLSSRIPSGKEYRASLSHTRRTSDGRAQGRGMPR